MVTGPPSVVAVPSVDDCDVIILVRNLKHVLPHPLILQMGTSWLWLII